MNADGGGERQRKNHSPQRKPRARRKKKVEPQKTWINAAAKGGYTGKARQTSGEGADGNSAKNWKSQKKSKGKTAV
jgi:hypothetical protein